MNITIEDLKMLEGGLSTVNKTTGAVYPTVRGRVYKQIIKSGIYAAFAYKDPEASKPPVADSALHNMEETCMPYKDGIDATLETFEQDPLFGIKPRKDLIRDIVDVSDVNPDDLDKFAAAIKAEAIDEQLVYMSKKNTNKHGLTAKIKSGLASMEEDDGTYDELFITRSVEFVLQYPPKYPSEADVVNISYLEAVRNKIVGLPGPDEHVNDNVRAETFSI